MFFKRILYFLFLSLSVYIQAFAKNLDINNAPGLFFHVAASGAPASINISLCLNGLAPLSCQNYTVSAINLSLLTTIPGHTYTSAGIKVNTPGYTVSGCVPAYNGYCLFAVSDTSPAFVSLGGAGVPSVTLVAGLQSDTPGSSAVISYSYDNGLNWKSKTLTFQGATAPGRIAGASCTGSGSNTVCVVGGAFIFTVTPTLTSAPLLFVSNSTTGYEWTPVTTTSTALFAGISCVGEGSTAVCIAAGGSNVDPTSSQPLIYISSDGGKNWRSALTLPMLGLFQSASCSGSGASIVCVAAGKNYDTNQPLLYVSTNGGANWSPATTTSAQGSFVSASCSGSGANAICAVAGQDDDAQTTLLFVSTNGGSSWGVPAGTTVTGLFKSTSCTGTGSNTVCTVAGMDLQNPNPSTLLYASSGGSNWIQKPISIAGGFRSTSCTGSGATAVCTVVGTDSTDSNNDAPLIYVSDNGGSTWSPSTLLFTADNESLLTTTCTGTGATATCFAGGEYITGLSSRLPISYLSTNGGGSWNVGSNVQVIPNYIFTTSTATGG